MADLEKRVNGIEKEQGGTRTDIALIQKDIRNIKDRIEKGISETVNCMSKKVDTLILSIAKDMSPAIKDNSYWVGKVKWGVFWVFICCLCAGIIVIGLKFLNR